MAAPPQPTIADLWSMITQQFGQQKEATCHDYNALSRKLDTLDGRLKTLDNVTLDLSSKLEQATTDITRLRDEVTLAATDRTTIRTNMDSQINTLRTLMSSDIKSNFNHILKTALPQERAATLTEALAQAHSTFDARLAALETRIPPIPAITNPTVDQPDRTAAPPPTGTHAEAPPEKEAATAPNITTPPTVHNDVQTNNTLDYTLPDDHLGSGLGGPSTPIQYEFRPGAQLANSSVAYESGHHFRGTHPPWEPYTPAHHINTGDTTTGNSAGFHPPSPCLGAPILSPLADKQCTARVSSFDVNCLATPGYHGKTDGVRILNKKILAQCGFNMISNDNVVSCYNDIISAHRHIYDSWHNTTANTYGPQVDRILLKSFTLFPKLESTATEDVVDFYDRFQELSPIHLLALIPFDGIVLKNRFEGLCVPGLGTRCYATCSHALMDFLPRLIPRTLSSRLNATLAAVRNELNKGFDYLWRVLELTVPGFDPVVPIQTPLWSDSDDIFYFSQAYLLYFCLQAKMHFHYTDRVRSSTFLWAIHHSDYTDTVTTLQSHVNSYCEDFDTGFLPPQLRLHGLAESIHLNALTCLRDIATPRVR